MTLYDIQDIASCPWASSGHSILPKKVVSTQSACQDIAVIGSSNLSIILNNNLSHETIDLDCMVDALTWSDDGKFLLLGDSSGSLHIVSKKHTKVVFSKAVHDVKANMNDISACFCAVAITRSNEHGLYNINAGTVTGLVYLFSNVPLQLLEQGKMEQVGKIKNNIKLSMFETSPHHNDKFMDLVVYNFGQSMSFYTAGFGDDLLVSWESNALDFTTEVKKKNFQVAVTVTRDFIKGLPGNLTCVGFVKIYKVFDSLFCLDNEGYLYQFEANYLFLLRWWHNQHFLDCTVRMPSSPFNEDKVSTGIIYGIVKDAQTLKTKISAFKFPAMDEIFSSAIGDSTSFCSAPCTVGDVCWTEKPFESDPNGQMKLLVKSICSASPDSRMLILLQQHKFDEALIFAKKYDLDPQDIYKQKASSIIYALSAIAESTKLKSEFENFKECANRISDPIFVAELCMSVALPDISVTYQLLTLAREHIDGCGRSFRASVSEPSHGPEVSIRLQIDKILDQLVTFQMAFSCKELGMWSKFRSQKLSEIVTILLRYGRLRPAAVLCCRHEAEFVENLEENGAVGLKLLLDLIPEDVATEELVSWMENVIPSFLASAIPNVVEMLAEWLHNRAEALEEIFPKNWPENGLMLANVFFKLQRQLTSAGSFREELSATYLIHKHKSDEVSKLQLLVSRLHLLSKLQSRYQCKVTLNEFTKETTTSLTFRMLDKVGVPELVAKCLETTVRPYMREHKLDEDETLLQYIEDVMTHCGENTRGAIHSLRERKVVAVIKCLKNEKVIVKVVCRLAKKASIPWSKDVKTLVHNALEITEHFNDGGIGASSYSRMRNELEHCGHLERIPSITAKYNLRDFFNRDNAGKLRFLRYLINQDTDEALEDALEVSHTLFAEDHQTPEERVYVYRVHRLIKQGKVHKCVELIQKMTDLAEMLVNRVVGRTCLILEETTVTWAEERANHCLASSHMIEYMLRDYPRSLSAFQRREWNETLTKFQNIHALQTKYGEYLTVNQYENSSFRDSILDKHIVSFYGNQSQFSQPSIVHSNVSKFGDHSNSSFANHSKRGNDEEVTSESKSVTKRHETFASVISVARLLKVPQQTMQSKIAIQAAKKCQVDAAINLCRDLYTASPSTQTANTLQRVSFILFKQLDSHPGEIAKQLPNIRDLVGSASTCCHSNDLLDVINLFSLTNIASEIYLATDMNTQDLLSQCVSSGPKVRRSKYEHSEWLHNWYHEDDGLNLRAAEVIPLVAKLRDCLLTPQGTSFACTQPTSMEKCKTMLSRLGEVSMQIAGQLASARHCVLALHLIVTCLYKTISHLINHKIFYQGDVATRKNMTDLIVTAIKQARTEIKSYMETLIEKILMSRDPDVPFAVGLLLDLDSDQCFQILNNVQQNGGKNYKKIMGVAQTGLAVARLRCMFNHAPRFEALLLDAKWAEELSSIQIAAESLINSPQQWKQKFLLQIIAQPQITGSLILKYCKNYNLDRDQALIQYVKVLLGADLHNVMDVNNPISPSSCLMPISQTSTALLAVGQTFRSPNSSRENEESEEKVPWSKVKEELKWLVPRICDKHELRRQLEKCFRNHVSPYDYDRCEFLLHVIESCKCATDGSINVGKGLRLINSLRNVKHHKPPTDYELYRLWNPDQRENLTIKSSLYKQSSQRLPLHPFLFGDASQSWKILTAEADENSACFLAPVAKLLDLNVDTLYLTAAENVLKLYTEKGQESMLSDNKLLQKIQTLTERMEHFDMAVAMAKRVSQILPSGENKVAAYKWCMELVTRWLNNVPEDSPQHKTISNALNTLARNYKQADTHLLLKENELDSADLLALINKPTELVMMLYKHNTILQRFFQPGDRYPDIHKVVNRLAEIHDLDIAGLQRALIYQLLLAADKPDPQADEESTVVIDRMRAKALAQSSTQPSPDEEETIFLLYLISHANPLQQAKLLVRWVGDHKNKKFTNPCRVRGLKCLLDVAGDDTIFSMCGMRSEDLRAELRVLVYLTELEAANFKITSSNLKRADKSAVARSIIASPSHRHNPLALRVAADLCREFGSVSSDTWVVLLQQLVSLQQVSYLHQLLPEICRLPSVRSLSCLPSVWQSCVTLPLVALTPPLEESQRNTALSSYRFLIKCPVLLRIDLANVAQHFEILNLHALALACLLMSPGDRDKANVLAINMESEIHRQLQEIHSNENPLLGHVMIDNYMKQLH